MQTSIRASTRPNWAEVSRSALRHNFRALQRHVGDAVTICAVVKCDAYGHGSEACALALEQEGACWFGVTSTDEAVALREAGVRSRILILVGAFPGEEEDALHYGLTPTVSRIEDVEAMAHAAARIGRREPVPVHLKLDTGMARLGLSLAELGHVITRIKALPQVELEGVFSHLASAEILDAPDALRQQQNFRAALRTLECSGLRPSLRHLANSSATLARSETWYNFVRPGMAVYGYELPLLHGDGTAVSGYQPLGLIPAMSWKTRVLSLRNVPAGQALGYNGVYVTPAPARIAVIAAGYGDGLYRRLSPGGYVLLRGQRAPMLGRISMDLTIVDVTRIPGVEIGDEVVLIGRSGAEQITAVDHARWSGTIAYEILCNLSERVVRHHVE
ncbi:MAG TPA: alanine racemase [Candidatus Eisenbacteria bacterium]|nr:alanine racemase [Candidatus Eisenbacteria bacterium]